MKCTLEGARDKALTTLSGQPLCVTSVWKMWVPHGLLWDASYVRVTESLPTAKGLLKKFHCGHCSAGEAISLVECQRGRHVASPLAMTLQGFFNTPQAVGHSVLCETGGRKLAPPKVTVVTSGAAQYL
jgi:hypothetical protein